MAAKRRVATLALALAAAVATVTAVPVGHAMDELSLQADRGVTYLECGHEFCPAETSAILPYRCNCDHENEHHGCACTLPGNVMHDKQPVRPFAPTLLGAGPMEPMAPTQCRASVEGLHPGTCIFKAAGLAKVCTGDGTNCAVENVGGTAAFERMQLQARIARQQIAAQATACRCRDPAPAPCVCV